MRSIYNLQVCWKTTSSCFRQAAQRLREQWRQSKVSSCCHRLFSWTRVFQKICTEQQKPPRNESCFEETPFKPSSQTGFGALGLSLLSTLITLTHTRTESRLRPSSLNPKVPIGRTTDMTSGFRNQWTVATRILCFCL